LAWLRVCQHISSIISDIRPAMDHQGLRDISSSQQPWKIVLETSSSLLPKNVFSMNGTIDFAGSRCPFMAKGPGFFDAPGGSGLSWLP
jgi:hypothetical protein